jgi:putative ABC transport system permease protein
MSPEDTLRFSFKALTGSRARALLMLLAMAIGVGSVIVLTALGEGARQYVVNEFSQLGTHLLIVFPGRNETTGWQPPIIGEIPRDLTLDDAFALYRSHAVRRVAPLSLGDAPVSHREREREATIIGTTWEMFEVRQLTMAQGSFLPEADPDRATPIAVLGADIKHELFGGQRALGQWVRINDRRFRVIGVLSAKGESLGADIGEAVFVPVAAAQSLFDQYGLFRILVSARSREAIERAKQDMIEILRERHDGEEDVTVITQDAVLETFDRILGTLTLAVAGIAAISLGVAGVLIMNVMLVAVTQRTAEIGLLKALGAGPGQILRLFLAEAALLSLIGAAIGVMIAFAGLWGLERAFPEFPLSVPAWSLLAATGIALGTGIVFGVMPARRAARLDPVQALAKR